MQIYCVICRLIVVCLGAGSGAPWWPCDDGGHHGSSVCGVHVLSSLRRAIVVILIVIINVFSSFNDADPSNIMLVDCCMRYCQEWGPIAAV